MILPIAAFGSPVLKKLATTIAPNHPDINAIIENMWQTMYNANGVGLAAPQIGKAIRLFIVDSIQLAKNKEDDDDIKLLKNPIKKVFINAVITSRTGDEWAYNEGCLSIPNIREDVFRPAIITIEYFDEKFNKHTDTFDTINARIIQHEYDHIEGVLFTDHLKPLKRKLLKNKLNDISNGIVKADYKMKFGVK
jgi:peptide deformylase